MKLRNMTRLLLAVALAAVTSFATAGMSMGSGSSRNYDRDSGSYPGYGDRGNGWPCRGGGRCTRDNDRQDYGQGMRMGGGQPRQQNRQRYRYGQGGPGYGQRMPGGEQDDQAEYPRYPQGVPGYGRGGPGYGQRYPGGEQDNPDAYRGYPQGGPGYGRGGPGAAPYYRQGGGF